MIIEVDLSNYLTAMDRCDACQSAPAQVAAQVNGTTLLFCNHHWNQHESALLSQGAMLLIDQRESLTTPLVGSY